MRRRQIINYPGSFHFLTFSTYQRRRFLNPVQTRDIVIVVLEMCLRTHGAKCAGFVIMPNHVHALIYGEEGFRISPFVQVWKKTSSYRIREFFEQELSRYESLCPKGCPIWQARFYDGNIEGQEALNKALDYMHANPVIAGLAETPLDWSWSSARFYELEEMVGVTITP